MELNGRSIGLGIAACVFLQLFLWSGPTFAQDRILLLNARKGEAQKSCVWPLFGDLKPDATSTCPPYLTGAFEPFLKPGHRLELRVFNRKFLTGYSITIDAVTTLLTGPDIRNLDEAKNLTLGAPTFAVPPTKGGALGLSARLASQILYELVDETTASKPESDLDADRAVIDREEANIEQEFIAFRRVYDVLRGNPNLLPPAADCQKIEGSPDAQTLFDCLEDERQREFFGVWGPPPSGLSGLYHDEEEFRRVLIRVRHLIVAVNAFGRDLASTDLFPRAQKIQDDIAQFENDSVIYAGNVQAAIDAATLAANMTAGYRTGLRRDQMRVLLTQKLKVTPSDPKAVVDDAELNALLDRYETSYNASVFGVVSSHWSAIRNRVYALFGTDQFRARLRTIREELGNDLPGIVNEINASQAKLLDRVNEIYDNSEVTAPVVGKIDVSKYQGNFFVYYTFHPVHWFTRFTVPRVGGVGNVAQSSIAGMSQNPPSIGATATTAAAGQPPASSTPAGGAQPPASTPPTATPTAGNGPQNSADNEPTSGWFEVHDFYHANVVAAFAFSTLKDKSFGKQAFPQGCGGTAANPNNNCFAPVVNSQPAKQDVIVGIDYYLSPRDTFPRDTFPRDPYPAAFIPPLGFRKNRGWLCRSHPLQCFGVMGAVSVTNAKSFFVGGFFEPVLGVQFAGGANFGSEAALQGNYQVGTPTQITGDFPTYQKRATGAFFSAGLDLGIFRKIFGKVTGIGTAAAATQGN